MSSFGLKKKGGGSTTGFAEKSEIAVYASYGSNRADGLSVTSRRTT
ncbi:MAG TPA: hypothetical protein VII75_15090 [Thermoanaerobaculia bacterium]